MKQFPLKSSLTAYSSDASIYAIKPDSVLQVDSPDEIIPILKSAASNGMSVTARGGGTGLSGGAVGSGYILDFGNYRNIIRIDPVHGLVDIEVGIIYDELNLTLKKYGLFFPPDPSSGDSCQIGGMLANNSSGPSSVKYGLTSDFVEELTVIKPSGEMANLKKLKIGSSDLSQFLKDNSDYEKVYGFLCENRELILSRWPKLKKNSSGYNLYQVVRDLDQGIFNLPALLIGSEGTLAIFVNARLRLLPLPKDKVTARLYFKTLVEAGRAVPSILDIGPSGLEIVDGSTLDLIGRDKFGIPASAAALLLVEFDDELMSKRNRFERVVSSFNLVAPAEFARDQDDAVAFWKARKAIVPTLYRHDSRKRPLALVEDISIPPDKIPSFIEYVTALFDSHDLTYGIFGHIGDGNLHMRPLFDLNNSQDLKLAQQIYETVYDKVIALGGSTTAEHADGRLRAPLVRKLYGERIYGIFEQIKHTLDPAGTLGPGVILSNLPFTTNIDYEKIKSYCAACGKCNGYCPAYDIFRREDYSPRGWLRMINQSGADRKELDKFLDFCLNCKNCTIVCPAGVDIASDILNYRSVAPSLASKVAVDFVDNDSLFNLSLRVGRLAEPFISSKPGRVMSAALGKVRFGVDRDLVLPKIARVTLRQRYPDRLADQGDIALFHGCADNLLESKVGDAIFKVFDRLGLKVSMPEQKCCGLPQEVYGHRGNIIDKAKYNIDRLNRFETVITGCASCLLKLKEYKRLFSEDDPYRNKAEELAAKCYDVSQFLNTRKIDYSLFKSDQLTRITYHNPCHLRAAGLHKEPEKLLKSIGNVEIITPVYADRCCAQAGSYGFVHYQESKRMFGKKKNEYADIDAEYLMTSCPACQMKIRAEMKGKFKVVHPVEILAERLDKR